LNIELGGSDGSSDPSSSAHVEQQKHALRVTLDDEEEE
jgi:hypothetical protein